MGAESDSRVSQIALNIRCGRVRVTKNAPRDRFYLRERRHAFAEIVERGVGVSVERLRVIRPHLERESMALSENASRHGDRFEDQGLGFFEAILVNQRSREVDGCNESSFMFFAVRLQVPGVYISFDP